MKEQHETSRAAEYVLGTLDTEARREFEAELEDSERLRQEVKRWEETLAPISEDDEARMQPSSALWERIESSIEVSAPGTLTIRDSEGEWVTVLPGVHKKLLHIDPNSHFECFLLRMDPGSQVPAHGHRESEECLVMHGDLRIGALHLRAGDFHRVPAGTPHDSLRSVDGALLYLRCQPSALGQAQV